MGIMFMSLICRHMEVWHSGDGRRSVDKTGYRKQDGNERKALKRKLYTEKISGPKILD